MLPVLAPPLRNVPAYPPYLPLEVMLAYRHSFHRKLVYPYAALLGIANAVFAYASL